MRYETKSVAIGEKLGPIDWNYPFDEQGQGLRPEFIEERKERLRRCEAGEVEATTDGGFPKVGWGKVLDTGMYDGWPYWRPVPSVLIAHRTGGASWHSWGSITDVRDAK